MWTSSQSFSNNWVAPVENLQSTPTVPTSLPYFSNSWFPPTTPDTKHAKIPESGFVKVNGQYWAMVPVSPQSVPPSTPVPEIKTGDIEDELSAQNLYKTELCRSFQETGTCRYGTKCQFAHGKHELRPVIRHPKYKTEVCKTFHTIGTCPYGRRCRFIHTRKIDEPVTPQSPLKTPEDQPSTFVNVTGNIWPTSIEGLPQLPVQKPSTPAYAPLESDIISFLDSDEEDDPKGRLSFFQTLA